MPGNDLGAWFARYRDYIKHEDTLINNRVMWLVTMQSILVGAFSLCCQKIYEVQSTHGLGAGGSLNNLNVPTIAYAAVLFGMGMIGAGFALISRWSIIAANDAITSLREKWEADFGGDDGFQQFPKLTGGNHKRTVRKGFQSAEHLATYFLVLWGLIDLLILGIFCLNWGNILTEAARYMPWIPAAWLR